MANKKYNITQTAKCNGVERKVYASVTCTESELDSFLALLEGTYIVMGEVKSGGSDANVTAYNQLSRVTFRAENRQDVSSAIFASNGGLVIKNAVSTDEIAGVISAMHPFRDDVSLKPKYESIKPVITAGSRL